MVNKNGKTFFFNYRNGRMNFLGYLIKIDIDANYIICEKLCIYVWGFFIQFLNYSASKVMQMTEILD